ncbi:MAG: hypothetical protein GXN96_04070 [Aquificae bacterium]|nr:hypothetical protein [Aquificota bacterium]
MRNKVLVLLSALLGFTTLTKALPVEVNDEELDRVYARGFFFLDAGAIKGIVEELSGRVLEISLPDEEGTLILAPSSPSTDLEDPVTSISIGDSAQENAINTVNSSDSAVNQVLNIIVIMNSNINRADLNIINRLRAIDIDLD